MKTKITAAALLCLPAFAYAQGELTLGLGFNYSSGDYGTSTTTKIVSIPFSVRYDVGRLSLKATVPYLRITGSSAVVPGIGAVSNTNPRARGRGAGVAPTAPVPASAESTESGLGDTVLAATYTVLYDSASKFGVDVTGKVKVATADADKGLGTGEHDAGVQVDAYKTYDRTTVFGGIGYMMLGSSGFIQLDNVWSANLGASYQLSSSDSVGASFDWREAASPSGSAQREIMGFWTRKFDRNWKAQVYGLKGFSDGSPDWGFGASAAYAF